MCLIVGIVSYINLINQASVSIKKCVKIDDSMRRYLRVFLCQFESLGASKDVNIQMFGCLGV